MMWLRGQAVKTLASHAGIRGSIPLGVIKKLLKEYSLRSFFIVFLSDMIYNKESEINNMLKRCSNILNGRRNWRN